MPARTATRKKASPARIDPVTAQVIRGALETIAFEMAIHVSRTATTPILNQSNERNATIMDGQGRLAALAVGIPQFMLSSMGPVQFALDFFGKDGFKEGDVIGCNDPYHGGGHLPDWSIFSPVFAGGEPILFASIQCHHADSAGMMPGGYPADAMDIWAEGFRCPALKLVDAGVERSDVVYLLKTNNRTPTYEGDLRAQIGAAQLGVRRCKELIASFGAATVKAAVDYMIDLSDRRMREEISTWPDGTYESDVFFDHDVKGNKDVKIHCKATVRGDKLTIDFTGSDDRPYLQAWSTMCNTRSMTMAQLCSMVDSSIPKNQGLFGPVEIVYPENTIVNPPPGRPVSMGTHHPGCEISEAVAIALSQAIPYKAVPQIYKAAMPTVLFGVHPKTNQLFIDHSVDVTSTVSAAAHGQDGWGCTNAGFGNLIMATAEVNESIFPHRQLSHDLETDTCGAGQWRGQCGSFYVKEATAPQNLYTFVVGMKYPSPGIHGGQNGSPNRLRIKEGGPNAYDVEHTALYIPIDAGERIEYHWAGGGGWGDPLLREPDKVRDDVLDEYISLETAEREYGVVLTGSIADYSLEVDQAATATLRASMS
ncbi:MAG: hydantoinase B/oxoprolinase family protein [Actinomycetota bacterium]